jgi:hypothetical protein
MVIHAACRSSPYNPQTLNQSIEEQKIRLTRWIIYLICFTASAGSIKLVKRLLAAHDESGG